MRQGLLFACEDESNRRRTKRSGSFVDNMRLPVHRWFRYSAGFSAKWAGDVIGEAAKSGRYNVFDPFAGSGTVVLEAEHNGVHGVGVEAHPFVARVARTKLLWRENQRSLKAMGAKIIAIARKKSGSACGYAPLITRCYPTETLQRLDSLKQAWTEAADGSAVSELSWLALVSILRAASPVGTAQWQYVLPKKSKARTVEPLTAFDERVAMLAADMAAWQQKPFGPQGQVLSGDARDCGGVADAWADLVVTSPPYANNYDYADATRLEMTFMGEIKGWGDLQSAVRGGLVRSCTQHVAPYAWKTSDVLSDSLLSPIADELKEVCGKLHAEKEHHGGKKQYDAMIAHYFLDMSRVWRTLRRVVKRGGRICFVVGDSAPYGVYVPVDRWLGQLALAAGFERSSFEKLRDRNTKWKNRKHRVLLQEGRLWVEA